MAGMWIWIYGRGFVVRFQEWWAGRGVWIERWRGVLGSLVPLGLDSQKTGQADYFSACLIELVVVVANGAQRTRFGNVRRIDR